jgi:hypothetical protein
MKTNENREKEETNGIEKKSVTPMLSLVGNARQTCGDSQKNKVKMYGKLVENRDKPNRSQISQHDAQINLLARACVLVSCGVFACIVCAAMVTRLLYANILHVSWSSSACVAYGALLCVARS